MKANGSAAIATSAARDISMAALRQVREFGFSMALAAFHGVSISASEAWWGRLPRSLSARSTAAKRRSNLRLVARRISSTARGSFQSKPTLEALACDLSARVRAEGHRNAGKRAFMRIFARYGLFGAALG